MEGYQDNLWSQVREIELKVNTIQTRQDYAFENLKNFLERYEHDEERRVAEMERCSESLREIVISQQAYSRFMTRLLPFIVVVFTAIVSLITTHFMGGV